jgi:cytochrome c peroxidase
MFQAAGLVATLALLGACGSSSEPVALSADSPTAVKAQAAPAAASVDRARLALFAPLPESMAAEGRETTPAKVQLGRMLYFDKRLSKNHDISCNSCHQLDKYGVDGEATSPGHRGQRGNRNSPTVYNAGGHLAQFWDGRAADLEAQAGGPVLNPVEMAMADEGQVLATLRSMPGYVEAFAKAFPGDSEPLTYATMTMAIGAFERTLVTPGRWDQFLAGDDAALSAGELKGLDVFLDAGCTVCHSGAYMGGAMFQKVGLVKPWPSQSDRGRGALTGDAADDGMFKVPSLRNIEHTGPYFHDGSVADLGEAVSMMAEYQLGKQLTGEEVASLVEFLGALSGELPSDSSSVPTLPPSTSRTRKPDPS